MKRLTLEELKKRNEAIRAGRLKDREYRAYLSDAVRRMKGKPRIQYMSHNAVIERLGG